MPLGLRGPSVARFAPILTKKGSTVVTCWPEGPEDDRPGSNDWINRQMLVTKPGTNEWINDQMKGEHLDARTTT